MKILILGGYGFFGGRLAQLLATDIRLSLIIAGRDIEKASAFCKSLPADSQAQPLRFDRDAEISAQLLNAKPDLLIDASGPFQSYAIDPYRVVSACIKLGVHYLDLADSVDFVSSIADYDSRAKAQNVFVVSGVSTCPAITTAVVDYLAQGMKQISGIRAGIAPSPYADVGMNVIRAIADYAGQPVTVTQQAKRRSRYALIDSHHFVIAPPGHLPLRCRRYSLVDVPDLTVLPARWPQLDFVWVGAAPAPASLHFMLSMLARLVRWRLLPSLSRFAALFHAAKNRLHWGEHRGGMFVTVAGKNADGVQLEKSWHLIAEGDEGPFIPCMAAVAIVRRCLDKDPPSPGARVCVDEVTLKQYDVIFKTRNIVTGERTSGGAVSTLYRDTLASAWHHLPAPIRAMHDVEGKLQASGMASVERGSGRIAVIIAFLAGFPKATKSIPVKVNFEADSSGEKWTRTFGNKSFGSFQSRGTGRRQGLICERFGPIVVDLALVIEGEKLWLVVRGWQFLGIPMPLFLAPGGDTFEFAEEGRFNFHVEIAHPLFGLIVRYRGWLIPDDLKF